MRLSAQQAASLSDFIWLKRGTYEAGKSSDAGFFPATPEASTVDTGLPVPENLANQLPYQDPAGWYPSPDFPQWGDEGNPSLYPNVDGAKPGCCEPGDAAGYFSVGAGEQLQAGNALTTPENLNLEPLWMYHGEDYQNVDPSRQWGAFSEEVDLWSPQYGVQGMHGLGYLGATIEASDEKKLELTKAAASILKQTEALPARGAPPSQIAFLETAARGIQSELAKYQMWTASWWNYYESSQVVRENTQAAIHNLRIKQGVKDGAIQGRSNADSSPWMLVAQGKGELGKEISKTAGNVAYGAGKIATRAADAAYELATNRQKQDEVIATTKNIMMVVAVVAAVGVVGYALTSVVRAKEAFGG